MLRFHEFVKRSATSLLAAGVVALGHAPAAAQASELALIDTPLFLTERVAPLNMIVMGRDHRLYYEAYDDRSDLNGDGVVDITYKPGEIDYYGYFDSFKCYTYSSGVFTPAGTTADKTCSGQWSGDWLNYVTTARIDALRKVLYGGFRQTDSATTTILERSHIPQDAHSWVKEYRGSAAEGYDISLYTPLSEPASGTTHLFANATLMLQTSWVNNGPTTTANPPLLRVAQNVNGQTDGSTTRAWHWGSTESPVAGACYSRNGANDGRCSGQGGSGVTVATNATSFVDYTVRVEVCVAGLLETNCRAYPNGNYKPIGLLQDFGENDSMQFGLMTGSYRLSKSGGMLRKAVGTIRNEISATDGTYRTSATAGYRDESGIIASLDRLRGVGYRNYRGDWYRTAGRGAGTQYMTGTDGTSGSGLVATRPFNDGEFGGMWGNPVAEMMYETLRYFAGRTGATSAFDYGSGTVFDSQLGLPRVTSWTNPYRDAPYCAKPFMTVVSDVNVSYDGDTLPGSAFGSASDDVGGLDVSAEADEIWSQEYGTTRKVFIGESAGDYDGAPSPKDVSTFSDIRGLAPEEPTKQGTYYAASVAKFGKQNDVNTTTAAPGPQNVETFAVALASPLPRIEIPVGDRRVTLVPFAKSVAGSSINAARGQFQPTNQIVDFYVESLAADGTSGTFLINFEDVEAGNDHDMDAIVRYSYRVVSGQVEVTAERLYEAGGITHHMGYVVSGTTADGIYLVVQDDGSNVQYFLDTPPGRTAGECEFTRCTDRGTFSPGGALPWTDVRLFTPGTSGAAGLLRDPLWYAAKWGGFRDQNNNGIPDLDEEWDPNSDGNPDNYFLVTNALTLGEQLTRAFNEIIDRVTTASSASVNSGSISSETRLYQAKFSTRDWTGQLLSFRIDTDTGLLSTVDWDAANEVPSANSREILTRNADGNGAAFRWDSLDGTRQGQLDLGDGNGESRLEYLRGDTSKEQSKPGGLFRNRPTLPGGKPALLGDIVSSSPVFVGRPPFRYRDDLEAEPYSAFRIAQAARRPMVYAGANDGMLHGFDGETGQERFAFIPGAVFDRLPALTDPGYTHLFYVDGPPNMGDVFFDDEWRTVLVGGLNRGGQGVYALDITEPDAVTESNADDVVLWEFTDADDADLGYTYSQPAIIRSHDGGRWVAVFGNGYNNTEADGSASSTGNAVLYFVDIETGALVRKIDTQTGIASAGSGGRANGLATPAAVDINGDGTADYVYAGDLYGNMWKFDIRNADPANWRVAYSASGVPLPLFTAEDAAGNRQPITSRPEVGRGPAGVGVVVLFGTGKFLEPVDKVVESATADFRVQSLYGIFDRNSGSAATDRVTNRSLLVQQKILAEELYDGDAEDFFVRVTSRNAVATTDRGWFMDLAFDENADGVYGSGEYKGEKNVANPVLRAGRAIFTTLVPDPDPCGFGGGGWLMEFDSLTGARLAASPFDLNTDRLFNDLDFIEIEVDGELIRLPVSGIASQEGIIQSPGILADPNRPLEFKYSPGTTGNIQVTVENPGPSGFGRQSWRQIR